MKMIVTRLIDKSRSAKEIYNQEGLRVLLAKSITNNILDDQRFAPYTRKTSRIYHQKIRAYSRLGYWPNILEPTSFNEKLMNRMLTEYENKYDVVYDKEKSYEYISKLIGEKYVPQTYFITDSFSKRLIHELPNSFVIKSNLGSGDVIIVHKKSEKTIEKIDIECSKWLSKSYYLQQAVIHGDYCFNYNKLDNKIIAEEKLSGNRQDVPIDYKFYVFHGNVEYVQVSFERHDNHKIRFYDKHWNPKEFQKGEKELGSIIEQPEKLDEMIHISEKIGSDFEFIRIDMYVTDTKGVKVGELSLNPGSGVSPFDPQKIDYQFGNIW